MNLVLKADGITHLTDARYFAALDVRYLVMDVNRAGSQGIATINAIEGWIDGPELLLQADFPDEAAMFHLLENTAAKGFQLPLITRSKELEQTLHCTWIYTAPAEIFKADDKLFQQNLPGPIQIQLSLADCHASFVPAFAKIKRIAETTFLSFDDDVPAEKILETINILKPDGLNLRGSTEEKPGVKSFDELDDLIEMIFD